MRKKITKVLLILAVFSLLIGGVVLAQRELEITYPTLNLVETPTTVETLLPNYIKYLFTLALAISGLIIFGAMISGGFRYFTSVGNPSVLSDAKDQIFSAFLGVIILLSSYLILNTINPQLVDLHMPSFTTESRAVIVTNSAGKDMKLKVSNPNLSDFGESSPGAKDGGSVKLHLSGGLTDDEVDIFVYPSPNYPVGTKQKIETDGPHPITLPIKAQSIEIGWKVHGVYLFSLTDFGGDQRVYTTSQATLGDFNHKAKSILMIPAEVGDTHMPEYGAVLFRDVNYKDGCGVYIKREYPDLNDTIVSGGSLKNEQASSIMVFKQETAAFNRPSEDGVTFTLADGSEVNFTPTEIGREKAYYNLDTGPIPDNSIAKVEIRNPGDYLVALYGDKEMEGKCEVFTSATDLSTHDIGRCWYVTGCPCTTILGIPWCPPCYRSCVSSFKIIPIKPGSAS